MAPDLVADYLTRIGLDPAAPPSPDRVGLGRLHRAHLATVPFENLDIHLGVPIKLDVVAFLDKIVVRRRGGFCYELNSGFAALLAALGFPVALLEARVFDGEALGIRYDHLCLRVDLDHPYLVDVGFGAAFDEPLRLDTADEQVDDRGTFRIVAVPPNGATPEGGWFDLIWDGEAQYRFCSTPRDLADFQPGCTYNQTSPDVMFTRSTVCTRRTPTGRITLHGLTVATTVGEERTDVTIDPAALGDALRRHWGISLTPAEVVRLVPAATTTGDGREGVQ